jgi:DHA1 family inner membrane transport protein
MGAAVTVAGLLVLLVAAKIDRPAASEPSTPTTSLHPTAA